MLGLKMQTDPRWAHLAQTNLQELLTDHAWCEQKAASNAISLMVNYPEYSDLVQRLVEIVHEEMTHFQQVHAHLLKRGWVLGPERKDNYVNELAKGMRRGGLTRSQALTERLLFAALIEARSCERFRMLAETVPDPELAAFYHELMVSEATHYTTFLGFARQYDHPERVNQRWQEFLDYEAGIMEHYSRHFSMHG